MLSVQILDFKDSCLLIQHDRLYAISVRQASVLPAASFRFNLTVDTLAVQLTVPPVGPVRDFHPQVSAPCLAHHKKYPDRHCQSGLILSLLLDFERLLWLTGLDSYNYISIGIATWIRTGVIRSKI